MSLAQKLILYALIVALVPLTAIGFSLVRIGEGALRQRIQEHQRTAAVAVAAKVSQAVEDLAGHMASVLERFDIADLSVAEREGLLRLLYKQSADITAAVLLDLQGKKILPVVYQPVDRSSVGGKLGSTPSMVAMFEAHLPRTPTGVVSSSTVLMSQVYFPADGAARVAVAIPFSVGAGRPGAVAGVEIALRDDVLRIEGIDTGPASVIFVVDKGGRVIVHPKEKVGEDLTGHGAVAAYVESRQRGVLRLRYQGETLAAAYAPVGQLGWGVIVEQPEAVAFAAVSQMRRQILAWLFGTAVVVLLSSLIFAGRLRRVLLKMVAGARAFGRGDLQARIDVRTGDEIGELATTMNGMAADLAKSLHELEEWSRTLEIKVEERTEELKQAQAQLLTQSKLAAIGQLGAGVAHEVNNPLAGILGYTQILIHKCGEDDPKLETLKKIEAAAKRCKNITVNLLRFSERGLSGRTDTDANEVMKEVVDIFRIPLEEASVTIVEEYDAELPTVTANSGQIALMLVNLLSNAKNAMASMGGQLTLRTAPSDTGITVTIQDTGHGIEPEHLQRIFEPFFTTKRVWTGVGLGLSVAYRIVNDHGGAIQIESEVDEGTTVTVSLPFEPPESAALDGVQSGVTLD